MQVLIALPAGSQQLAEEIEAKLDAVALERSGATIPTDIVFHAERVMKVCVKREFSYCVVHDELPKDAASPPAPGGGLALSARLRALQPDLPIALLHARPSWLNVEAERMTELNVTLAGNSVEGIRRLVERIMNAPTAPAPIDITIDLSHPRECRYRILSEDVPVTLREGCFALSGRELDSFRDLSRALEHGGEWTDALTRLSRHLFEALIADRHMFQAALLLALKAESISDRSCLHFHLDAQQYEVAFEAIRYPDNESYWMLRAPVYRSLADGATRSAVPLFRGAQRKPLSCLIVCSCAAGEFQYTDEDDDGAGCGTYADLKRAGEECDQIRQLLEGLRCGPVGDVAVIGRDAPLTLDDLVNALTSRRWDLIHYIGHTDYRGDRGYLILPGREPGRVQAAGLEEIGSHMSESRFVYLSSCEGTRLDFVRRLADHGVSSMLGFRTKVRDDLALLHARYFYERLFALSSLERAFLETRQHFHQKHPADRLWACSSLVMQRS